MLYFQITAGIVYYTISSLRSASSTLNCIDFPVTKTISFSPIFRRNSPKFLTPNIQAESLQKSLSHPETCERFPRMSTIFGGNIGAQVGARAESRRRRAGAVRCRVWRGARAVSVVEAGKRFLPSVRGSSLSLWDRLLFRLVRARVGPWCSEVTRPFIVKSNRVESITRPRDPSPTSP